MSSFELYNKVIETLNTEDFSAAARNWIESGDEADFHSDEANELFYKAKACCVKWRGGAIDGRISKQRMIDCVRKIAEMNLPNPYPKEVLEMGINPETVKLVDEPEAIQGSTVKEEIVKEEPIHVLGVVPKAEPEIEEKKVIEKPKDEKPNFFGKHKKR